MKEFYLVLFVILSGLTQPVLAQCPPPGFPEPGNTCPQAPVLCENLNGYCATINNSNTVQTFPGCPGWQLNNDEWFAFFAGSTSISIQVVPSNCSTGGQMGLQGGIYAGCGPPWTAMALQCSCTTNPFTLTSNNYVIGQIYYFVLDGCAGNVCDYTINVLSGSTVGVPPNNPGTVTGPVNVCQGTTTNYSLPPVTGATNYTWTVTPALGTPSSSITNNTAVSWGTTPGSAQVCVTTSNYCFSNPTPACITVNVVPVPTATLSGSGIICAGSNGTVNLTVTFTGTGPWTFVHTFNGAPQAAIQTSSNPYTLVVNQPGNYGLQSVSSVTGNCPGTVSGSAVVTQPVITPSATTSPANCGLPNGGIDLSVAPAGTYTYNWSNGETTQDLTNVLGGTSYTVTVTDANGCTNTASYNVANNTITFTVTGQPTANTACSSGTGSITTMVNPSGSYTYIWSNGETTANISNLTPGTYTVTVSAGGNCTQTASFTVADQPNNPSAQITPTASTCNLANGGASVTAAGGVTPYTYVWSNGATTPTITNVLSGSYTVTVTGANGCTATASTNIGNNDPPITVTGTPAANTTCIGGNGSITITATPPGSYTYTWSNGETTTTINNLVPGTYTVTVSAGGTCTQTASFTIADQPNNPIAAIAPVQSTCDLANGSANLTATGGVSPYTFLWSNGATTQNIANVLAGSYTVTVTGANGCTASGSVNITNNNPPITVTGTSTANTTCNGGNGSVTITATPPNSYTYIWSNGATTTTINNLVPGTYTVTVSAGGTCTQTASFTVPDQPNNPIPAIAPVQSTCDLANGSANLTVTGGVSPYTFNWSNGATTQNITNVLAGSYTVTVTGANGCTATATTNVGNNNPPITVTGTPTANTTCNGGNGSITINATPPNSYTYIWSTGATTTTISNLTPGTYTVTVSAGGTCSQTASFTVPDQPNNPNASIAPVQSSCDMANGSANLTVTGGVSPYTFNWSNGATTQNITNVLAGSYTVTVTGANGCTTTATTNVTNNNPPINIAGTATANTSCNSNSTGSININVTPSGSYTYTWSNGATTTTLNNLPPGTYTVTVSAGGTCTQTASFTVPDQPNNPSATITPISSSCGFSNGSANLGVSGGVSPYTFLWSNGATTQIITDLAAGPYTVTVTGANGCTTTASTNVTNVNPPINITGTTTANTACNASNGGITIAVTPPGTYTYTWSNGNTTTVLNNLPPGTYTVTVSAGGTCTQTASFTVPDQPNNPSVSSNVTPANCGLNNGNVSTTVTGGVSPFTYNWSNGATTNGLANVAGGNYTVTVTGANGCTVTSTINVPDNQISFTVTGTATPNNACTSSNGSITINVTPPGSYTYLWSNGNTTTTLSNLGPGTYSVTVSAGGTCTQTTAFTVANEPSLPTVTTTVIPASCGFPNGSTTAIPTGGVPPFTYLWSNGFVNQTLSNVLAGNYTVTVTGANGCSAVQSVNIPNNNPPMTITGTVTPNTSCVGGNGSINVFVVPGGVLTYTWSNGATTPNPSNLSPGTYTVTVSAGGTCTETASFTVPDNSALPVISSTVTPSSCNQANGAASIIVSGGIQPYTFLWSNGAITQDLNNVLAGNYTVTVTAGGNCTAVSNINITNNNPTFTIDGFATGNNSCTAPDGQVNVTVQPPGSYTYLWSNGQTSASLVNVPPATYTVTVSAGGSCTQSMSFIVFNFALPPNVSSSTTAATCNMANGAANLTVSGGTSPYTYLWSNGSTTQNLTGVAPGSYQVTVTGANGCTATASAAVGNNNISLNVTGTVTANTSCTASNGAITANPSPAGTYTYLWSTGATTQTISNLAPGSYAVTVSAGGTCTATASFTVQNNATPPNLSTTATPSSCGLNNGAANLTVSGGASPYTFIWSNTATSEDLSNIAAGTYSVTVTGANGCTATANVNVANNNIALNVTGTPVANTSCVASNGSIDLSVSPAGSYTFIWSNSSTTEDISNLAAGPYTVTVSAGGTCTTTATFTVTNNTMNPVIAPNITPAICSQSNGGIDLTITGNSPFTFLWSNAATTEDLSDILPGNYTVTVTGVNGCTSSATLNVPNNSSTFSLSGTASDLTSCVTTNGAVNLTITPSGSYGILWSNGAVTEDLNNLTPGTYTVTVTESGSCTASASFVVADLTSFPSLSQTVTTEVCGLANGSVDLTVTGGTTPYTYIWSNAATTQDLTNISMGSYAVTVTGANGCSATASANVPENTITFSLNGTTVANGSCAASNGAVDLEVTPAGTYTYTWSNAATTEDLNGLLGGNYTVTVSAGGTCTNTATFTVPNNTDSPQFTPAITSDLCSQTTGGIDLTVTGSTTPYTFLWSNAATTEDIANVAAGNYSVTVTGANGCANTDVFTIPTSSITINVSGTPSPNTSCDVNDGSVNLTVTPAGTYTYLWSTGATTQNLSGVAAGNYSVTVSAGGSCTSVASFNVTSTTADPVVTQTITPAVCGLDNGAIDLNVTGPGSPYVFIWSNGKTTEDLTDLLPGNYSVTVTATNGCKTIAAITVPNNTITFSVNGTPVQNTACTNPNGVVNITVSPAGAYTYLWSNGETTEDLANIPAGNYTVTVSAGGSCTSVSTFTVTNNPSVPTLTQTITSSICGAPDGGINLTVNGGAPPNTFLWSNAATTEDLTGITSGDYSVTVTASNGCTVTGNFTVPNNSNTFTLSGSTLPNTLCGNSNGSVNLNVSPPGSYVFLWSNGAITEDIGNLPPGNYSVTVSDGGSCSASSSFTVGNNAPVPAVSGTDTDILCFGQNNGSIALTINGGVPPYNYDWTPTIPGNPQNPTGLAPGAYSVVVTDASGCSGTASFTITQPASAVQIICSQTNIVSIPGGSDGAGSVTISGGIAPYKVTWSPGSTQNNVPAGVFPINNLTEGSYAVTVTDANGCIVTCNFTITSEACETKVGTMSSSLLSLCGPGCLTATYNSTGQFLDPNDVLQYILHTGSGNQVVGEIARNSVPTFCFNPATMSYGTTYYISAVAGNNNGSGNVVLSHFCTVVSVGTPIIFNPKPVANAAAPEPITCAEMQVGITSSSSVPGSTFSWTASGGGTIIGSSTQPNITAGSGGNYTLIVSAAGCKDTTAVQVNDLRTQVEAFITATPANILDCTITSVTLTGSATGVTNPTYLWVNSDVVFSTQNPINVDFSSMFTLIVLDTLNFCGDTTEIEVIDNGVYPPLNVTQPGQIDCKNTTSMLSGSSPVPGIQFVWVTIAGTDTTVVGTGPSVVVTQPGTYYFIGTDPDNGCKNGVPVTVNGNIAAPTVNAGPDKVLDCYQTPFTVSPTSSPAGLTYLWTVDNPDVVITNPSSPNITIDEEGIYTLTVTNPQNFCTASDQVVVQQYINVPQAILTLDPPACFGFSDGSISVEVDPANGPYEFKLNGKSYGSSTLLAPLKTGDYHLVVSDGKGCVWETDVFLPEPELLTVELGANLLVELGDEVTIQAQISVPLNVLDTILWTPDTLFDCPQMPCDVQTVMPLYQTTVGITVIDTNGCRATDKMLLVVSKSRSVYIPNSFSPNGDGTNDLLLLYGSKEVKQVKKFLVFDRWGETVYQYYNFDPNDPAFGWDGTHRGELMKPQVFVYFAIVEFIDGSEELFEGDITLMR